MSSGDAASYVVARINVTDVSEAPTLAATVSVVVAEDAPLGAVAGQIVAAADEDAGDALTFAFEPADGAAPVDFTSGGQLTVTGALDYETRQSYAGVLTATDAHGLYGAPPVGHGEERPRVNSREGALRTPSAPPGRRRSARRSRRRPRP